MDKVVEVFFSFTRTKVGLKQDTAVLILAETETFIRRPDYLGVWWKNGEPFHSYFQILKHS